MKRIIAKEPYTLTMRSLKQMSLGISLSILACGLGHGLLVNSASLSLFQAIRDHDVPLAERMLQESGDAAVHGTADNGITPLHIAAALNQVDMVAMLLEHGADAGAVTGGGFTALHWAAGRNAAAAAELLLDQGADIAAITINGITPLHWAANNNATNVTSLLLIRGADPLPETASGRTPLHWAVMNESQGAAISLAFQVVSEQMEQEPPTDWLVSPTNEVPGPEPFLDATTDLPLDESDGLPPVDHLPRPAFGRSLTVPIGFGESLHFTWLDGMRIWVGTYEVTNGQFRRFRPKHKSMFYEGFSLNGNSQPAVYVSWNDARDLCKWLNKTFRDRIPRECHFRLPLSQEWQAFARCGDNRLYPWGSQWPPRYGNFSDLTARQSFASWEGIRHYDDGYAVTCPVTKSGANEWGLYGLGGNVWEWCDGWYDAGRTYRIRHGGGWDFDGETSLRVSTRGFDRPEARYDTIGIRLVVSKRGKTMVAPSRWKGKPVATQVK